MTLHSAPTTVPVLDPPAIASGRVTDLRPRPRQLTRKQVLAVWAAAAIPMAMLMWVVGPLVSLGLDGPQALIRAVIASLTVGLVWQFVLVMALVAREQHTLRWSTVREVLWLRAPRSPRTGRVGGRVWLVVIPLLVAVAAEELVPSIPHPASLDLGKILASDSGQQFLQGSWGWFAVLVTMFVFNTVLGEELLFRGYLLPRMSEAFGRRDWAVNGVLFACYHLHRPWHIPSALLDAFVLSWTAKRFRSAWIGIAVHSAQSVLFTVAALAIVLK